MNELTGLQGKIAIITGGTQGLGAAIAKLFAERGASGLVLCGRQTEKGQVLAKEIEQQNPNCKVHFVTTDLAESKAPESVICAAEKHFGKMDVLVNVAGISARGTILDTDIELYDRIMNINVRAPFFLMQHAAKLMRKNGNPGAIVSIGSIAAYAGAPFLTAYCTSKGALNTMTRNVAHSLMRDKIRVNCLNIGWMSSDEEDIVQRKYHGAEDGWQEKAGAEMPFGRIIDPNEAARAVAFLASDESGLMTGSIVNYDQTIWGASDGNTAPQERLPD